MGDRESTSFNSHMSLLYQEQGVGTSAMTRYALRSLDTVSVTMLYSLQINTRNVTGPKSGQQVPNTRSDRDDKLIAFLLVLLINFSVPSRIDGLKLACFDRLTLV